MAAAGLVLAAAAGGAVFSGSAPTPTVDWGETAGPARTTTTSTSQLNSGPPAYVIPSTTTSVAEPTITVLGTSQEFPPTTSGVESTSAVESSESEAGEPASPSIPPSPAVHLWIPAIAVDAQVLPVDSVPTGAKNAWGGEVFEPINFPVDRDVRQWVRRGDPNSVPAVDSQGNVKAFDRTVLYGHASDIGHHLIFQDLSALRAGDSVTVDTALGRFSYAVTAVVTRAKTNLDNLAALYEYPTDGRKELALVGCLPDSTSNVVVFATLASAKPLAG
jgi:LPXTG-site transpeptidase (sortase) family protein